MKLKIIVGCGIILIALGALSFGLSPKESQPSTDPSPTEAVVSKPTSNEEATALYQGLQTIHSQDPHAWLTAAMLLEKANNLDLAIASYKEAIKLNPQLKAALHRIGVALAKKQEGLQAYTYLSQACELNPNDVAMQYDLALVEIQIGKQQDAANRLKALLEKNPAELTFNLALGDLYMGSGQYAPAIFYYQRAIQIENRDDSIYNKLGCCIYMLDLTRWQEAMFCYKQAIEINPQSPLAYNNMASLLRDLYQLREAITYYQKAIELDPHAATTYCNLGLAWLDLKEYALAEAALNQSLQMNPQDPKTAVSLAMLYMIQGQKLASLNLFQQVLKAYPDHDQALAYAYSQLRQLCHFDEATALEPKLDQSTQSAIARKAVCFESPFISVYRSMDPAKNLAVAKSWSDDVEKRLVRPPFKTEIKPKDKLTIGYLSYDFFDHATLQLTSGLFRLHDKERFNIHIYSYGPDDQSDCLQQLRQNVTKFVDISQMTDDMAAQKIFEDGVDILVDLKGHTLFSKPAIAMYRPAPIQISYLGFPGTTGSSCFDYILTDPIVTPKDQQRYYTEKFLYMPFCYQVNDDLQKISDRTITREEVGLPQKAFVFASFNATYKLESTTFDSWMRLLNKVPSSVLWLYCDHKQDLPYVKDALEKRAQDHNVDPQRLIFTTRQTKAEHLKRLQLADLILDTRTYNGHTTTSDALWAGVPVVTLQGSHFASRVSSSLLTAVGTPELVTHSMDEYETLALHLATHPKQLQQLRNKIAQMAPKSALFDTRQFVERLEKHYRTIYDAKIHSIASQANEIGTK